MQLLKVEFQQIKISCCCSYEGYPNIGSLSFSPRGRKTVEMSQKKS